ncbi:MAG: 2-hydroxyacid dehydrogenase [Clostridiales bacterium]|nr:2-hydroxyacid dehydrogenase [Clostridiales bacterium]
MRIAFFDAKDYDREAFENAPGRENFDIAYYDTQLNPDTCRLAEGAQAVCVFVNDRVDGEVIDRLSAMGVKLVALRCAGYNNVEIEKAYKKIHVVRVPAYSPYAVAEHAMALLLTSIRRIHKAYIRTRDFNFSLNGLTGFDLHGKTVGIVGTGKIGRVFADICRGFGMRVIGFDKYPAPNSGIEYVTLDEIWKQSDIISFHCPLTDENRHMANAGTIGMMKKGVVLINTSRGGLIDSEALLEGIKSRQVGAACLDVYEEEADVFFHDFSGHIVSDDTLARLISMPNVIITSHQAFLTREALGNIAQTTLENISAMLENGFSANEICYKCDKLASCAQKHTGKCF